jgi:hypothetical protein
MTQKTQKKKKSKKKRKSQFKAVAFAVILVMGWLGIVFTLFPVSNPVHIIGGQPGAGFFYASLWAFGIMILLLIFYAARSSIRDILEMVAKELGFESIGELTGDYKKLIRDEFLIMQGKKERGSDHHIPEEEDEAVSEPKSE